jgi:hypothetical protein
MFILSPVHSIVGGRGENRQRGQTIYFNSWSLPARKRRCGFLTCQEERLFVRSAASGVRPNLRQRSARATSTPFWQPLHTQAWAGRLQRLHLYTRNPIPPNVWRTAFAETRARPHRAIKACSELLRHAFQLYGTRRRKAGDCAGQHGSREYRRDPECLRQELWGRARECGHPSCRSRNQCRSKRRENCDSRVGFAVLVGFQYGLLLDQNLGVQGHYLPRLQTRNKEGLMSSASCHTLRTRVPL